MIKLYINFPMMNKRIHKSLILLLSGGIVFITFSCNNGSPVSEEEQAIVTPVTVTEVNFKPLTENIELPAVSAFLNRNIVRSSTTGNVETVTVMPGDYVSKNQILFSLKTREALAMSASLKTDSSFAFKGEIKIPAPKSGVISSISHQNGDFVQEGDELAVISEEGSFVFILEAPFELRSYVDRNKSCTIKMPDGKTINGTITGRLSEMDSQSQTVKYIIRPSGLGHLPANLNVLVSVEKSHLIKAAVLPKEAVLGNETQTEFWIMVLINDTTAVKVPVKKGIEINNEIEISEPVLLKTDRIIVTGGYGLPDTARVMIKQ
jgi:biotin carboxyl carrier protein